LKKIELIFNLVEKKGVGGLSSKNKNTHKINKYIKRGQREREREKEKKRRRNSISDQVVGNSLRAVTGVQ
jgi:hypothetical protein